MMRVGIIGFGYMGHFHYEKMSHFESITVTCVFDCEEARLQDAKKMGLKIYRTLNDFLKEDLDLVIIATPNQWHEPYAVAAIQSGKHVLCEKPATRTVAEMEHIMNISNQTGKIFTVHQQRRFDPDYRVVKNMIEQDEIGKITRIESRVLGERGVCFGWRADPHSGGGMLYDWGVHLIDQILQLYPQEMVESVYARVISVLTPAVDDLFELTLNLSNGLSALINVGTFALQKLPRWFVFGDRGTLKVDDFSGTVGGAARIKGDVRGFDSVVGQKSLGPSRTMAPLKPEFLEKIDLPVQEDLSMEFWRNLEASFNGTETLYVTSDQIMRQMKVVEAAFASAQQNEVIKIRI